ASRGAQVVGSARRCPFKTEPRSAPEDRGLAASARQGCTAPSGSSASSPVLPNGALFRRPVHVHHACPSWCLFAAAPRCAQRGSVCCLSLSDQSRDRKIAG